jgi:hypothetical protein
VNVSYQTLTKIMIADATVNALGGNIETEEEEKSSKIFNVLIGSLFAGISSRHWQYLSQYIVGPQYQRFEAYCCVLLKKVNNILLVLC